MVERQPLDVANRLMVQRKRRGGGGGRHELELYCLNLTWHFSVFGNILTMLHFLDEAMLG